MRMKKGSNSNVTSSVTPNLAIDMGAISKDEELKREYTSEVRYICIKCQKKEQLDRTSLCCQECQ